MTRRRSPRPIELALELKLKHWAPETLLAEIQRGWGDAVGPAIAAEAKPSAERAGVLTVCCSASVWAQELDLMAPTILERLNTILRSGRIGRLRCVAVPGDPLTADSVADPLARIPPAFGGQIG